MKTSPKTTGLRYWMQRVLDECDHVAQDFSADPVHDLRVGLRRCRSMADGLIAMDPDPAWKAMKKAGKQLFQSLGALRDVQVMMEWTGELFPTSVSAGPVDSSTLPGPEDSLGLLQTGSVPDVRDPGAQALRQVLSARENELKRKAQSALEKFDRKQWRQWSKSLPARAAHFRPGSTLFKHLALERWTEARALHSRVLRNRSQVTLHQLRIGIKRFRYIVENFLPEQHKVWSNDLKYVQDLLGEVHDLDVLWTTALSCHVLPDEASRKQWRTRIADEKAKRIASYREKMTGPHNLWEVWRAALPRGNQLKTIASRRVKLWAKALDPDPAHSERVGRLAQELYEGLRNAGLLRSANGVDLRSSLVIAAMLHDVGKVKGDKGHHKTSFRLIREHGTPLGWKKEDMRRAALAVRFHCGPLPTRNHKEMRDLLPQEQKTAIELTAIFRLANAFDTVHDGRIRCLRIGNLERQSTVQSARSGKRSINGLPRKVERPAPNEVLVIAAEGYSARSSAAQIIAAERHLLETVLHRPVIVKPMTRRERGQRSRKLTASVH